MTNNINICPLLETIFSMNHRRHTVYLSFFALRRISFHLRWRKKNILSSNRTTYSIIAFFQISIAKPCRWISLRFNIGRVSTIIPTVPMSFSRPSLLFFDQTVPE